MTAHPLLADAPPVAKDLRADLGQASRTLATITLIGLLFGVLVVGVLARLGMALLAGLNPGAVGITSDDGFEIGRFTLSGSVQLALAGLQFGIAGVFGYVAARGLMIGPSWFRVLSISLGPGVVIGAILVDTDGVDFTVLDPAWLAAALFVALPTVFVALLHLCSERALGSARQLPTPLVVVGLLPWVLLVPLTLLLFTGFLADRPLRHATGRAALVRSGAAWLVRGALAVVFVWAIADLVRDLRVLS